MNIILNEKSNKVQIEVFGQIGESFFEDGFTVNKLREQLEGMEFDTIELLIQSMGGSAYEGTNIYELLNYYKSKGVKIITRAIGLVASAGATILVAGDERIMSTSGMMLVHFASGGASGKEEDIESGLVNIKMVNDNILDIYSNVTGKSKEELTTLLDEDRWMSAKEAKKWGFITNISKAKSMTNDVDMMELVNKVNESNLPKIEMEEKNNITDMNEEIFNEISSMFEVEEESNLVETIKNKITELEDVKNVISVKDEEILNLTNSLTEKDETILELTNKSNELTEKLAEFDDKIKDKEIEDLLNNAISTNRINKNIKDIYKNLLIKNFDDTKELLSKLAPVTPINILEDVITIENDERKDWDYYDWQKQDPEGLKEMSINNTRKYEEIKNNYYNK